MVLCSGSSGISIDFGFKVQAPFVSRVERFLSQHHQMSLMSLMSQLGGASSAFRYKTDLLLLKGSTFISSATKTVG